MDAIKGNPGGREEQQHEVALELVDKLLSTGLPVRWIRFRPAGLS